MTERPVRVGACCESDEIRSWARAHDADATAVAFERIYAEVLAVL